MDPNKRMSQLDDVEKLELYLAQEDEPVDELIALEQESCKHFFFQIDLIFFRDFSINFCYF